jgi:hypothetical protein
MLLLKFRVMSASLIHCSVVLWRSRNPVWLVLSRFHPLMCLWIIFRITFSKSLLIVYSRLIGRRFWEIYLVTENLSLSLPSKCESRMQWLIKWVFFNPILFAICTSTFSKLCVTYTLTCRRELSSAPV